MKFLAATSDRLFIWKLKSSAISKAPGLIEYVSKSVPNSSINSSVVALFTLDERGR